MEKPTYEEIAKARAILKKSGIIDHFWHVDDIIWRAQQIEKHKEITREQAYEIAELIANKHDASVGINWEVMGCFIDMYFEK